MALWNNDPFGNNGSAPFGQAQMGGGEVLSADSVKCPSCASNIFYEPQLDSMICRKCGNVYAPITLEPRGSLGIKEEHDYMGDSDMTEDDKKRHEIVCNSCGATLVTDEHTMSTMCPFCGSPALISRRMTREFKPDYIIPFKIDKENAQSIMKKWISEKKYTPLGFRSKSRLTSLTALYVPFWLLDCAVNSDLSGTGTKDSLVAYEVHSKLTYYVKGLPFNASIKIANKLMEAAEPYDYSEMIRFESRYLQGFYANKYDQLPTEMTERIIKRIDRFSASNGEFIAKKYTSFDLREDKCLSWLSEISVKYCLLPVWFMTVEFGGRDYQFAVNGQTGEACGQLPSSNAGEIRDSIIGPYPGKWKSIAGKALMVIPVILMILLLIPSVSTLKTNLIIALSAAEIIIALILIVMFILKLVLKHHYGGEIKSSYELTDYDKDPGLDCYYDSTRQPDVEIKEVMIPNAVTVRNGNGRVIGENSVDL
ncbi:MAG: hypothetical protein J5685_04170 [Clostridiales bacterium]|nr:hypothetical protein [Clostridiales bacterium]